MKAIPMTVAAIAVALATGVTGAQAACVTKGAIATSDTAESAKWYALETMVQAVSWSLWPGFLSNGKVEGYRITGERYTCKKDSGGVTCRGRATFCKT